MMHFLCRPDGHQNNLRSAAYEALMEIVKNSAKDCYPAVQKTTLVIMERLQQVLQMEVRRMGGDTWGKIEGIEMFLITEVINFQRLQTEKPMLRIFRNIFKMSLIRKKLNLSSNQILSVVKNVFHNCNSHFVSIKV